MLVCRTVCMLGLRCLPKDEKERVCQRVTLLGFFPICKNTFPIIDQFKFFETSGLSPDILILVLEDCIVFLIWEG